MFILNRVMCLLLIPVISLSLMSCQKTAEQKRTKAETETTARASADGAMTADDNGSDNNTENTAHDLITDDVKTILKDEEEKLLSYDLDKDYPKTPYDVAALYCRYMQACYADTTLTDVEREELLKKAVKLVTVQEYEITSDDPKDYISDITNNAANEKNLGMQLSYIETLKPEGGKYDYYGDGKDEHRGKLFTGKRYTTVKSQWAYCRHINRGMWSEKGTQSVTNYELTMREDKKTHRWSVIGVVGCDSKWSPWKN